MKFTNVRDLSRLGYFSVSDQGKLLLRDGIADEIWDAHTHLGWSFLVGKRINLWGEYPTKYFFPESDNPFDLDKHLLAELTPTNVKTCRREVVRGVVNTRGYSRSHTIPNLLAEMDRMRITRAVVLAIDIPSTSKNSENMITGINREEESRKRLISFVSMHPGFLRKRLRLNRFVKAGAMGIKLHPQMQMFRLNTRRVESIYELAKKFGLPILTHTGLAPIAPKWQARFVKTGELIEAVSRHPEVKFVIGHAAMENYERVVRLANTFPLVYLDISGQTVPRIKQILKTTDPNKIVYGSDWPFYPMEIPLAKTLLATEGEYKKYRPLVFYQNTKNLLGIKD